MDGISIIVTAYDTQDYIEECLDSIYAQTWFNTHNNYEILLGIDHCEKTLKKVESIIGKYNGIKVIYMDKNYGTYITSNTLISIAKYDWILRFDSDDIMKQDMVESIFDFLEIEPKTDIIRFYCKEFFSKDEIRNKPKLVHGVLCINASVFKKYGAFMSWSCGADSELLYRLKNEVNIQVLPKITFLRRKHEKSLTSNPKTGFRSEIREKYHKYIKEESHKIHVINTEYGNYVEIGNSSKPIDTSKVKKQDAEKLEQKPIQALNNTALRPVTKKVYMKSVQNNYCGV